MNKLHPLRTGALYGIIAGVLNVILAYINSQVIAVNSSDDKGNPLFGAAYSALIPIVAIYLAGHITGRQERMNLGTTITSGTQATLFGTVAGISTGVVYVIISALLTFLAEKFLGFKAPASVSGGFGAVVDTLQNVGGFIGWLIFGLLAGTVGGFFGDSRAHKQLKSGVVQASAGAKK